jgi:fructose-bisphosphate aldolase class II
VKINIGTALNSAYTTAMRATLNAEPAAVDPRTALSAARDAVADTVAALLTVLAPVASVVGGAA